ncbi:MAG: MaoC/PaaZ C-terminal domain-containing protein, partial [Haloechinothrix sp.]
GDFHPVHMNEEVAKTTQFGGRIAHGPLIFALATGLFTQADKLNSIAFLGMEWRFLKPVALGDTVRVRSELIEKRLTKSGERAIARHKREVLNQRDEIIEEGETSVMMLVDGPR